MRKNYVMLALASMMMAACANNDLVDEGVVKEEAQAIGFETFANKGTRAAIDNVENLKAEGVGFTVWGYKTPKAGGNQYTVFNGVDVTYTDGKWGYNDAKYWDRTSTYNFYAVAPSTGTYSIDETTGMITVSNAASAKSTESMDYVIDRNGVKGVDGNYTGTSHDAVEFDFHHIMSKISFKLKAAVAEDITVTNLTMTGWDSGEGKFVQALSITPSIATHTAEWTITTPAVGNVTLVGSGATDATIDLPKEQTPVVVQDMYIMVPQTIAANTLTFTIDFTIDGETFTAQVGKLAAEQVWGTDAHVTYIISVGPDLIDFTVSEVCGWCNAPSDPSLEIE